MGGGSIPTSSQDRGLPFRDRPPSEGEIEKLRLMLGTFQDGSGDIKLRDGSYRAGWRQVERVVAEMCAGSTAESKAVFDVDVENPASKLLHGLSVKTSQHRADGRVLLELSNSPAKMLDFAEPLGLTRRTGDQLEWDCTDGEMGHAVMNCVISWHDACRPTHDVDQSAYVVLTHDRFRTTYRLYWFVLDIGLPTSFEWEMRGRALTGIDSDGTVRWQFYPGSGGQLKWYPAGDEAKWRSGELLLPPPPSPITFQEKAEALYPEAWPSAG
jgi:hypothetical protein